MRTLRIASSITLALLSTGLAHATPSSNFWAPSYAVQGFGVLHTTYDTYFHPDAAYPIDVGLEIGVLSSKRIQMEVGFDLLYPTYSGGEGMGAPILLNGKLGAPEGAYFEGSPGWSAGIMAAGFEENVTDYNMLHAMLGKTFGIGTVSVGVYHGLNEDLFRSSTGEEQQTGLLAGWFSPAIDVPHIDRIHFVWDIQTGENVWGATGGGIYMYLTPSVDLLMGPVFFFDPDLQPGGASWMWSVQLDADIDFTAD